MPASPAPIPYDRVVPLIVAVALFMENMDSTVIATSLPAIARSLGTNPLALKLAVTSYLLALAIFIPASGWTADRFGARNVFRIAIGVFVLGSIGCALSSSLEQFVLARIVQGIGGAMMTPVGRLILVRSIDKRAARQCDGAGDHPGADRPDLRPAARRLHHHLRVVALDFHHQRADRPGRSDHGDALHSGCPRRTARLVSTSSASCCRVSASADLAFGLSVLGLALLPSRVVATLIGVGAVSSVAYVLSCPARRGADPRSRLCSSLELSAPAFFGGFLFRLGIGALPFLLPLLLQIGFNLTPFQSGLITFTAALGAMFMKAAVASVLQRFGYRPVLVYNSIISAAFLAACASFVPGMPFLAMIAILLTGGFFRSLQFTSVNTIAYAEIEPPLMSRATTIVSVVQQLALSTGVAVGALIVEITLRLKHAEAMSAADFPPAFLVIGALDRCLLPDLPAPSARRGSRAFRARQRPPRCGEHTLVAFG